MLTGCSSVSLEPAYFAGAVAGDHYQQLPLLIDDPKRCLADIDGDGFACVGHAHLDALAGNLDPAAARDLPLDGSLCGTLSER
jgi:hypothetical protein